MFSLPYAVSTAILTSDVLLEDFSVEAINKPERLEFAKRIHIEVDDSIDRESKELNVPLALHEIRLQTGGGKHFSQKLYYAKGFPEKPMALEDFFLKIKKCAPLAIKPFPEDKIEALRNMVINLEKQEDTKLLAELLY
jgi:2-methylcitrate dehydratase PrpD